MVNISCTFLWKPSLGRFWHSHYLLLYVHECLLSVVFPSYPQVFSLHQAVDLASIYSIYTGSDKLIHESRNTKTWAHSHSVITPSSNTLSHTHTHPSTHKHSHRHVRETISLDGCVGGWRQDNLPKLLRDYCKVLLEQRSFTNCSEISWGLQILRIGPRWQLTSNQKQRSSSLPTKITPSAWDSDRKSALTLKVRYGPRLWDLIPDQFEDLGKSTYSIWGWWSVQADLRSEIASITSSICF